MADFKVGDRVKTSYHGYVGCIEGFQRLAPRDAGWVEAQSIPFSIEEILGEFVDILVDKSDGGGAVRVPVTSLEHLEGGA